MPIFSKFYTLLHKTSKRFSRHGLYDWLDLQIAGLQGREMVILNIGSGGDIFQKLKMLDKATITQIDIDPARKPDIVADVCHLPMIADNSVDAVFMLEVLEHVKTPQDAVNELYRVLKPTGKLYLSTPFIFPIHDEPYDFYRYTKYGLTHLLSAYTTTTISERNDYVHAIMVLFARAIIVKGRKNIVAGMALFLLALLLYPALWGFAKLYSSPTATTGYVTTATK